MSSRACSSCGDPQRGVGDQCSRCEADSRMAAAGAALAQQLATWAEVPEEAGQWPEIESADG